MKTRPLIRNAVVLGAGVMLALLLAAASARSQTPPRLALPVGVRPSTRIEPALAPARLMMSLELRLTDQ